MAQCETITAIDVGTTKVFSLIAKIPFDNARSVSKPELIATSTVRCDGLQRGNVEDITLTAAAIKQSLKQLEDQSGVKTTSAYVGVTGSHVLYENKRNLVDGIGTYGVITPDELNSVEFSIESDDERMLLHAMPISYSVDGADGIRNPVGMHSNLVSVDTHIITADRSLLTKLLDSCKLANVKVKAFVMEPFASGLATLTEKEREQGTLIIDIGGGTTDIVGFKNDRVIYTGVIPVGGYQFTNDIAYTYNSTYESAEKAKIAHGHTELTAIEISQNVTLQVKEELESTTIPAREIGRLLRERAIELAQMVQLKLDEFQMAQSDTMRVVLTGGGSKLPGITHLFQRYLGRRVRLGKPSVDWFDQSEMLQEPSKSTGVGILIWASSKIEDSIKTNKSDSLISKLLRSQKKLRLSPWMRPATAQISERS